MHSKSLLTVKVKKQKNLEKKGRTARDKRL